MAEAPNFVLFEHAVGYTLLKVKEFEDIGNVVPEVSFVSIIVIVCFYIFIFLL